MTLKHMAKPKKPRTLKQRQADRARRAVHAIPFVWRHGERIINMTSPLTACGKRRFRDGQPTKLITPQFDEVDCAACARLVAMDVVAYNEHITAQAKKLQDVRIAQQEKVKKARAERDQERWAFVHQYQDDALVALDAYLSDAWYPQLNDVLAAAVEKYKLEHPESRGEKLWVMTGVQHADKRNVVCRFCRRQVGRGDLGKDYSASWFDVHSWREFNSLESYRQTYDSESYVCVGRHTTLCALAYLAGAECVEPVPT